MDAHHHHVEHLEEAKMSVESLVSLIQAGEPLLLLDLRSFLLYNQSHVAGAINVCIPKTLAKRHGFTVLSIESGICKKADKDEFALRQGKTVVLYDQSGTERDPNTLLCKCFDSLFREALCKTVHWLEGPFFLS